MSFMQQQIYPYSLPRHSVYAKNGMVATSQPLASQVGLTILKKGGNAVDAAIATAACLSVVEPTSNGIGGDAFAIVWVKDKMYGLNASGDAPELLSIDKVKQAGFEEIPLHGWLPVTVPGQPSAWVKLSERFGKLSLAEVLEPAIQYAQEGFPVSSVLARYWKRAFNLYSQYDGQTLYDEWFKVFAPKGRAPYAGELWHSPDHALTLKLIAQTQGEAFYKGEIAQKIDEFSKQTAGYIRLQDLADYEAQWVEPIKVNYRGYDVWEIPPNSQGIIALQALNILKGFEFKEKECLDTYHKQIEAVKLAFTDALNHVTEPQHMVYQVEQMLSEEYAQTRRALIKDEAVLPVVGEPFGGGTVYLATADKEGNMVSFIQSNYRGFGSGVVVPGTGIALQNRGANFSLNPNHVNALAGNKKSYHTIIPGFLTKNNQAIGPFGVMGAFMQPQGHVQVLMNTIDFNLNPQAALDAPRWQWIKEKRIELENRFPHHLALGLLEKGHDIAIQVEPNDFGRGQIIWRDPDTGILIGGSESRTDGSVAAW